MEGKLMKKTISIILAAIIFAFMTVPAVSARDYVISPTASKEYKIIVHNTDGGSGSYTTEIDEDGKHATVTAHPKKGYEFVKWKTKGKYDLLDGDLTDEELEILLKSDVEFTPVFRKIGTKSSSSTPSKPVSRNASPISPKTSDSTPFFIIGFIALALAACAAVGIKLATAKK